MNKVHLCITLSLIVTSMVGCKVHTVFNLKNESGQFIVLTSGHTKEKIRIGKDESKDVDHTIGDVLIEKDDGTIWRYGIVSIPDIKKEFIERKKRYYIYTVLKVYFLLKPDGKIYLLKGPQRSDADLNQQPEGFPLLPMSPGRRTGSGENGVKP